MYSNDPLQKYVNVAIYPHLIDTKSLIPVNVKEYNIKFTGLNCSGKPEYVASEARKRGVIRGNQIKWINY